MTLCGTPVELGSPTSTQLCVVGNKKYLAVVKTKDQTKAHSFMFESDNARSAIDHMYSKVGATAPAELPEYQLFEVLDKYKYVLVSQKPVEVPPAEAKRPPRWKIYYSYKDQKEAA